MRTLTGISSMATKALLAERVAAFENASGLRMDMRSVGGVDAARRVRDGEAFDVVVLATDALDKLADAGRLAAEERVDWVRSETAIAVRSGARRFEVATEAQVRQAVLDASTVGCSTGPSGVALAAQFARWGIADAVAAKSVQAPPGVPVGRLIAEGEVELGFQQTSELLGVPGIDVLGPLPASIAIVTTFGAAVCRAAGDVAAAAAFLRCLTDPAAADVVRRHGMEPAFSPAEVP